MLKLPIKKTNSIIKKALASFLAGAFLFSNTLGWAQEERLFSTAIENIASSSRPAQSAKLAPALRASSSGFKELYKAAAICRLIESEGSFDSVKDIVARLADIKSGFDNVHFKILPNEILIEIPDEGMAVRYFDPAKANVVTPYSDISKLTTKVIGPLLNRQIIHRMKVLATNTLPRASASGFTEIDKKHMTALLQWAKDKLATGELNPRLPVVARIVDKDGTIISTATRTKLEEPTKYGVKAVHAEIQAIREAKRKGFTGWEDATLYTNLSLCYNCNKAIAEFYGIGRVVYGVPDKSLPEGEPEINESIAKANGVELIACDDGLLIEETRALFAEQWQRIGGRSDEHIAMIHRQLSTERDIASRYRQYYKQAFGEDIQVRVFDADLWQAYKHNAGLEKSLLRSLDWFKQNLNPGKRHIVIIIGEDAHCTLAKRLILESRLFKEQNIEIGDKSAPRPSATGQPSAVVENYNNYVTKQTRLFADIFGEKKEDVLVRVPIEAIEKLEIDDIKSFLSAVQTASNGYVELYHMSGAGAAGKSEYRKFGLRQKSLPKDFEPARENTVTLFSAIKGEELNQATLISRLGSLKISPQDTILSPIGREDDSAGLIRSTILGLRIMSVARDIRIKGISAINRDDVQREVLEDLKFVFDRDKMQGLTGDDIIALANGNINSILAALKKLIKLLPITPIDAEELRQIYEHAKQVLVAA